MSDRTAYFSLGFNHAHAVDGFTYDKDVLVKITAPDPRARMFEVFGGAWSFEYGEADLPAILHHFPRGIKELP